MADMTAAGRRQEASRGQAMPDGRFPIENRADLQNAIRAVGRVRPNTPEARAKVRRFIIKRARALGATSTIPASWNPDGSLKS